MKPVFLIALMTSVTPIVAMAREMCTTAHEMEASLIDWYGETLVEGADRLELQMWASQATGTWTLVRYLPDGNACTVAHGHNWAPQRADDLLLMALAD